MRANGGKLEGAPPYPKRVRLVILALGFPRVSVGHHEGKKPNAFPRNLLIQNAFTA
jgi:hypothetical protein